MPATSSRAARKRSRNRGQSLAEFALIFPVFILILAGMIDFGIGLYSYMSVINSARDGARLAATSCSTIPCQDAVIDRVNDAAGGLSLTSVTVVCTDPGGVTVDCATGTAERGDDVTVTVLYDYKMIWPLGFGTQIPMTSTIKYMVE